MVVGDRQSLHPIQIHTRETISQDSVQGLAGQTLAPELLGQIEPDLDPSVVKIKTCEPHETDHPTALREAGCPHHIVTGTQCLNQRKAVGTRRMRRGVVPLNLGITAKVKDIVGISKHRLAQNKSFCL